MELNHNPPKGLKEMITETLIVLEGERYAHAREFANYYPACKMFALTVPFHALEEKGAEAISGLTAKLLQSVEKVRNMLMEIDERIAQEWEADAQKISSMEDEGKSLDYYYDMRTKKLKMVDEALEKYKKKLHDLREKSTP